MSDQVQIRRDTLANWSSANPILLDGELGWEYDTARLKIGDGATAWNLLAYFRTIENERGFNVIRRNTDTTIISDGTVNDDEYFFISVAANKRYNFELKLIVDGISVGIEWDFTGPASPNKFWFDGFHAGQSSSNVLMEDALSVTVTSIVTNDKMLLYIRGHLDNGANAGTLQFRWAQGTSTATPLTLYAGSLMYWKELG